MMGTAAATRVGTATDAGAGRQGEVAGGQSDGFLVALGAASAGRTPASGSARNEAEPAEAAPDSTPTALPLLQLLLPAFTQAGAPSGDGRQSADAAAAATDQASAVRVPDGSGVDDSALSGQLEAALQFEAALAEQANEGAGPELVPGDVASGTLRQLLQPAAALLQGTAADPRLAATGADLPGATAPVVAGSASPTQPSVATSATAGLPMPETGLRQLVGSPRWADELGSRMVMMSVRGQHEGSLSLAPEHLGPLEVRISMQQGSTHVWFGAQHADTRAALAEALPRLREMFAEAGLSLGQAGVSHESPRQQDSAAASASTAAHLGEPVDAPAAAPAAARPLASALLDLYA